MIEIVSKEQCVACSACYNVCPKKAIFMKKGELGFQFPYIDESKCIECNLCKKVCPIYKEHNCLEITEKCYVAYSKLQEQQMLASSGGIFPIIANYTLSQGGIVVGAAFDDDLNLKHFIVSDKEKLQVLLGSKYVQSDLGDVFSTIKDLLRTKKVLFIGTPCQVAGLKSFLGNDNNNLLCIDLICHGVPATELFEKYIAELEMNYSDKVITYNFRDKTTGWETYSNVIGFKKKKVSEVAMKNDYMNLFLSDVALRESCYNCQFKLGNKYSDLTLGDFWGVKEFYPEMYNDRGTSAILINTNKGIALFENIKRELVYKECSISEIVKGNPALKKSAAYSTLRQDFITDIKILTMAQLRKKYCKERISLKWFAKKILKKIKCMIMK